MTTITPFQFFAAIFGETLEAGQLMVWSKIRKSGKTVTDWCYDLPQAGRQVELYRRTRDVYFGVALQDRKRALDRARRRRKRAAPSTVRGTEESVAALPALWAEIAFNPHPGDGRTLPPGPLEALALFDTLLRPPSIVVSTGTALQAYWRLGRDGRPWVLAGPDERRRAKALLAKIRWALASAAAAEGWRTAVDPGAPRGGLAALMRVAGTFRHRGGRRWPIVVERLPRGAAEDRSDPADFEDLEDPPKPASGRPPWEAADPLAAPASLPDRRADFRAVWQGCSWLRHCHRDQAVLPEAEWRAALSIVGRTRAGSGSSEVGSPDGSSSEVGSPEVDDGRGLAHRFSNRHPGYAPELTDQALKRVLGRPAATCGRIGRGLGAWQSHCSRCPHQGRIGSPIVLAAGAAPAARRPETGAVGQNPDGRTARDAAVEEPSPAARRTERPQLPAEPAEPAEPQVELVVRIPSGHLPLEIREDAWAPLVRAAIDRLERSLSAANPAAPAPLVDGLEELLASLGAEGPGGSATARQLVEALAAPHNRGRFETLRAALRALVPGLDGGVPTAMQLARTLSVWQGRHAGGRTIARGKRSRAGIAWMVRQTDAP